MRHQVTIVGGGLAGSEAAWQLAERGVKVRLYEMRPHAGTPIHVGSNLAELVCSNSLKSLVPESAAGLLKYELAAMGSFVLRHALSARVPAGGALAVDRELFSTSITVALEDHPNIEIVREEVRMVAESGTGHDFNIIATGPLTSDALAQWIEHTIGQDNLAFFDAAAPIVEAESLDRRKLFAQSRYDKGEGADYLNAAMDRQTYEAFIAQLIAAKRTVLKDFENDDLFAACQPVEEIARKGIDALRYGALKPVGIIDPLTGKRPWAVIQLRAENKRSSAYNLVGFQTNLTFSEQERVFRMIPGLENAAFSRHGVMHRNTFIDTPHVLDDTLALPGDRSIRFAGQITGTEGYGEAIASGLFAALCTYADLVGIDAPTIPAATVFGSLLAYATDPAVENYQPMHVNYGIIEPLEVSIKNKRARYGAYSARARTAIDVFVSSREDLAFLPTYTVPFL